MKKKSVVSSWVNHSGIHYNITVMNLSLLDWAIVLLYLVASLCIGLYFTKRASSSVNEFFLSGRNLPWWLAGTSMVATTFAADTPLAVTELVAQSGVAGNWLW